MNQDQFIQELRRGLADVPAADVAEIIADYQSYFNEAQAAGRNIDDVVAAHGDPRRLAQELRAEMGFRQWEDHRSPRNFWKAALALGGLAAVDLVILIPGLLVFGALILILFFVLSLFGVIGIGTLIDLISGTSDPAEGSAAYLLMRSIGFVAASVGGGALVIVALRKGMTQLTRYARLHYRLLHRANPDAAANNTQAQTTSSETL